MNSNMLLKSLNYFVNFARPGSREICDILMEKDLDFFPSPTHGPSWLNVNGITYVGEEAVREALDSGEVEDVYYRRKKLSLLRPDVTRFYSSRREESV